MSRRGGEALSKYDSIMPRRTASPETIVESVPALSKRREANFIVMVNIPSLSRTCGVPGVYRETVQTGGVGCCGLCGCVTRVSRVCVRVFSGHLPPVER